MAHPNQTCRPVWCVRLQTLSAPKSVSLMAIVGGDGRITVAIANHPPAPVGQLLLGEPRHILLELRGDRGLDPPTRARPQELREGAETRAGAPSETTVSLLRCAVLLLPKP